MAYFDVGLGEKSRHMMTLRNAPPGLLVTTSGIMIFKSEYCSSDGTPKMFVMSGESYCANVDAPCIVINTDEVFRRLPLCPMPVRQIR